MRQAKWAQASSPKNLALVRLIDESIGENPHAAEGLRARKKGFGPMGERSDAPPSAAVFRRTREGPEVTITRARAINKNIAGKNAS